MPRTPQGAAPPLGPAISRFLPTLIEKAALTNHAIGPDVRALQALVADLRDHMDFEIGKLELAVDRARWGDRADPDQLAALDAQIACFRTFRETHTGDAISASLTAIGALIAAAEVLEAQSCTAADTAET